MFYSIMSLLHDKLPCAAGYFKLRNDFKLKRRNCKSKSSVRIIAHPKMIPGLSPTRNVSLVDATSQSSDPRDMKLRTI